LLPKPQGVRNLQQQIDKIMRKVAHQVVVDQEKREAGAKASDSGEQAGKKKKGGRKGSKKSTQERADESGQPGSSEALTLEKDEQGAVVIKPDSLGQFLGKPPFSNDRYYDITPPGVVMGLAWTSMGTVAALSTDPFIAACVFAGLTLLRVRCFLQAVRRPTLRPCWTSTSW
jgi:Lon-like ATP-dependent protease